MLPEITLDFSALGKMPTDKDLPHSDGEPLETSWHRTCMTVLIDSLEYYWRDRKDFFVGGDMFLYFSADHVFNKDFRGPDFFVVKGVEHDKKRLSYVAWRENSRLPCVIVELGSESTLRTDRGEKKKLYEQKLATDEYFIYDPVEPRLEGWRLLNGSGYSAMELEHPERIWSKQLELYVGVWSGAIHGIADRWLRFYDVHGSLIPTGQEAEAAGRVVAEAHAEKAKAAAEASRLAAEVSRLAAEAATAKAVVAEAQAAEALAAVQTETIARTVAEARTAAVEDELERLRKKLAALQPPPTNP